MSERRKFSRLSFPADSILVVRGARMPVHLIDISMKGALVSVPEGWEQTTAENLSFELQLRDSDIVISMEVEAASLREHELGLHCRGIDLESITHLRRLLELNLGDPGLVERELSMLG